MTRLADPPGSDLVVLQSDHGRLSVLNTMPTEGFEIDTSFIDSPREPSAPEAQRTETRETVDASAGLDSGHRIAPDQPLASIIGRSATPQRNATGTPLPPSSTSDGGKGKLISQALCYFLVVSVVVAAAFVITTASRPEVFITWVNEMAMIAQSTLTNIGLFVQWLWNGSCDASEVLITWVIEMVRTARPNEMLQAERQATLIDIIMLKEEWQQLNEKLQAGRQAIQKDIDMLKEEVQKSKKKTDELRAEMHRMRNEFAQKQNSFQAKEQSLKEQNAGLQEKLRKLDRATNTTGKGNTTRPEIEDARQLVDASEVTQVRLVGIIESMVGTVMGGLGLGVVFLVTQG